MSGIRVKWWQWRIYQVTNACASSHRQSSYQWRVDNDLSINLGLSTMTCDSQSTQHGNILIVTGNKVSKIEANTRGFYINITVKYIALPLATKYLSKQNHQIKPLSTQLTSVFHFYWYFHFIFFILYSNVNVYVQNKHLTFFTLRLFALL